MNEYTSEDGKRCDYKCKTESSGMTGRISKNLKLDKVRIEQILN